MNIWKADGIMDRLNEMLDRAIAGEVPEKSFDETKMSSLETKLYKYMTANQVGKQHLEEQQKRISELISDISHQTKTPIANLLLYSELLAERMDTEKETELCQIISAIHEQTEKLSFLLQTMITISRLENGIIRTVPAENQVQQLINACVNQLREKAGEKSIRISAEETDAKAVFDPKWTREALCNLLDNAVKYTDAGGHIAIEVSPYQLFTRIDVRDNGMGIPEEEQNKVFRRFYRGEAVRQLEGVGLGLYLAREIITGQGGYIRLRSRQGEGTVFSVFLPNSPGKGM